MTAAAGTRLLPKNKTLAILRTNGGTTTITPDDTAALLKRIDESIALLETRRKAVGKDHAERIKRLELLSREITGADGSIEVMSDWLRLAWSPEDGL